MYGFVKSGAGLLNLINPLNFFVNFTVLELTHLEPERLRRLHHCHNRASRPCVHTHR